MVVHKQWNDDHSVAPSHSIAMTTRHDTPTRMAHAYFAHAQLHGTRHPHPPTHSHTWHMHTCLTLTHTTHATRTCVSRSPTRRMAHAHASHAHSHDAWHTHTPPGARCDGIQHCELGLGDVINPPCRGELVAVHDHPLLVEQLLGCRFNAGA